MTLAEAIAIVREHAKLFSDCQTPEALRLVADAAEDKERLDWVCQQIEKASFIDQGGQPALYCGIGKLNAVAWLCHNGTPAREAIDAITHNTQQPAQ